MHPREADIRISGWILQCKLLSRRDFRLIIAQIITQHEPYEIICVDTNLNFPRSDHSVYIQVFQQGRNAEQKQKLYVALGETLGKECGVKCTDLIVSCSRNEKVDWSFGMGMAQFLAGDTVRRWISCDFHRMVISEGELSGMLLSSRTRLGWEACILHLRCGSSSSLFASTITFRYQQCSVVQSRVVDTCTVSSATTILASLALAVLASKVAPDWAFAACVKASALRHLAPSRGSSLAGPGDGSK